MSANFKFQSFADEDDSEPGISVEKAPEKAPETSQSQMKKIIPSPWDNSRDDSVSIPTATIHTEKNVASTTVKTVKTVISHVTQFSRLPLLMGLVAFIFVIAILAVIVKNEHATAKLRHDFVHQINVSVITHQIVIRKLEKFKELYQDSDKHLREEIISAVEDTRQYAIEALRNFSDPHETQQRQVEEAMRSRIQAVDEQLRRVDGGFRERMHLLEGQMQEDMRNADRELQTKLDAERMKTNVEIERESKSWERLMNAKWSVHDQDFKALKEKLDQDQTDTKVQIGAILDELKDKHSNFATQLDKLKKKTCDTSLEVNCDRNAECINTLGSFLCLCHHGWTGDGKNCIDINECGKSFHDECHVNADCTNTPGSYTCACKKGYTGDGKDKCEDVDECKTNPCHATLAVCINTPGSFKCECLPGYTGDGYKCEDANECDVKRSKQHPDNSNNCHEDAICTNTISSFKCSCKAGFTGDGVNCTDIDECVTRTHNCSTHATCSNTKGSYNCHCHKGYSGDGKNCEDIDECKDPKLQEPNPCSADSFCTNTHGHFGCTCLPGFKGNGLTCDDIDECADMTLNNCSTHATCANTKGGYTCTCIDSHEGDGVECRVNYMKASGNYTFHSSQGSRDRKDWYAARDACKAAGGYLAIVGNEQEDILIRRQHGFDASSRYWVGGKCEKTNGVNRNYWVHTNIDFANSYPQQNYGRNTNLNTCDTPDDGILMRGSFGNPNAWDDISARSTPRRIAYICEYS